MSNLAHDLAPVACAPKSSSPATKLLQAAALAAVLVPLGSVAVETATITCTTTMSGGGCSGSGSGAGYYNSGGGSQTNTWEFYFLNDLIYTFEIEGTPTSNFSLNVADFVTTQGDLLEDGSLMSFPNFTCVPTYDVGQCGLFDVTTLGTPSWQDGYRATITWFENTDPLSMPSPPPFVTILQAKDGTSGVFGNMLDDIEYYPYVDPSGDPAIGGKGNSFSRFGVFATTEPIPEPASVILLGTGLAGALYGARRRKRRP